MSVEQTTHAFNCKAFDDGDYSSEKCDCGATQPADVRQAGGGFDLTEEAVDTAVECLQAGIIAMPLGLDETDKDRICPQLTNDDYLQVLDELQRFRTCLNQHGPQTAESTQIANWLLNRKEGESHSRMVLFYNDLVAREDSRFDQSELLFLIRTVVRSRRGSEHKVTSNQIEEFGRAIDSLRESLKSRNTSSEEDPTTSKTTVGAEAPAMSVDNPNTTSGKKAKSQSGSQKRRGRQVKYDRKKWMPRYVKYLQSSDTESQYAAKKRIDPDLVNKAFSAMRAFKSKEAKRSKCNSKDKI